MATGRMLTTKPPSRQANITTAARKGSHDRAPHRERQTVNLAAALAGKRSNAAIPGPGEPARCDVGARERGPDTYRGRRQQGGQGDLVGEALDVPTCTPDQLPPRGRSASRADRADGPTDRGDGFRLFGPRSTSGPAYQKKLRGSRL
jgi:hypothetical protein